MLRNVLATLFAVHLLGPIWSVVAAILLVFSGVGLMHLAWHLLLVVTMP